MAIAVTTLPTLPRVNAISAMASRMGGIDINPSITRITTVSSTRMKPDINPMVMPTADAMAATENPTMSDTRAPYSTREYRSRPSMSVPNQYCSLGKRVRLAGASAVGSTVPSQGAKMAMLMMIATSNPPTAMVGWR